MQQHSFTGKAIHMTGISLILSLAEFYMNRPAYFPQTLFHNSWSAFNTWFHWNSLTFCVPLQDDSRGFLLHMGSGLQLCLPCAVVTRECCDHSTHTSPPHCPSPRLRKLSLLSWAESMMSPWMKWENAFMLSEAVGKWGDRGYNKRLQVKPASWFQFMDIVVKERITIKQKVQTEFSLCEAASPGQDVFVL